MLSSDSGQCSEELQCTPRRAQKRLFGPGGSIIKRSLFQAQITGKENDLNSGDESDLGPMSPLALTNGSPSSADSSPGRQFVSPLITPEGSPQIPVLKPTWDRLTPTTIYSDKRLSPFSSLKHITRKARSSPRRRIFPSSPKSTRSPRRNMDSSAICSLSRDFEIIPETPLRGGSPDSQDRTIVKETPEKENVEHRMITPLGSVNKDVSLPRLHRRKTLGAFDIDEISPEKKGIALKRHMNDSNVVGSKLQKIDEGYSIPKARASLFQDYRDKSITVNTKSFYGSGKRERLSAFGIDWKQFDQSKKRRSLPVQKSQPRPTQRRHKKGDMNSGVTHGIKRPKPKKHISRVEAFKKEKQSPPAAAPSLPEPESFNIQTSKVQVTKAPENQKPEKQPSPVIDPTKRFFKTVKPKPATVTVNNKIKLNVTDGKISLNQKNIHKKPKVDRKLDISLDANDLIDDEPGIESKNKDVEDLLRILDDDWGEEEYEPMETIAQQQKATNSSQECPDFQNSMMSPSSELSSMTSIMNIEDAQDDKAAENKDDTQACNSYYPLFTKGYSSNREEPSSPRSRGVKRAAVWQLSAKAGGAEDQYQIDCGQSKFGATQCNECGIVYQVGDPQDENAHLNFHNSTRTLKFQGWKNERVIWEEEHMASRIILIDPNDSKQNWKKVSEILNVVDADLGLVEMQLSYYRDKKVYLYVRDKNVLGVLVVEPVKEAHRMIPELIELDCCSSESTPAKCGVNVVWTALSHRRQGIARQLVDTLRRTYFYGYIMTIDDIAFSTPTPSGKIFALKYTKTENFKVYS